MIYVPNLEEYEKYEFINENIIRAYKTEPQINEEIEYRDYFVNSHYVYNDGKITYKTIEEIPTYISENRLTNEIYYRNDFDSILIIFISLAFICFYLPYKIFMKIFKKR